MKYILLLILFTFGCNSYSQDNKRTVQYNGASVSVSTENSEHVVNIEGSYSGEISFTCDNQGKGNVIIDIAALVLFFSLGFVAGLNWER